MEEYRKKLAYYVYHINYVRMSHAVRLERLGYSPGEVSLIMDYSEKLNKTQREAAHSQYWDSVTLTLEVAVAEYYKASLNDADRTRLAASLVGVDREKQHAHLGITLDQMNEVTSHGKDEADGHGGVIKTWLTNEMRRVELDKGEAPAMQLADMVNGVEASFAATAAARGGAEMGELKVAHMNKLRREKSNTVSREFRTCLDRLADEGYPRAQQLPRGPGAADAREAHHLCAAHRVRVRGLHGAPPPPSAAALRAARHLRALSDLRANERLEAGGARADRGRGRGARGD
mmetsp:Transcript_33129/g.109475  ORF Transcript_33129/g.109475 Transcript_33129/m.109475 type:complete len:289 (-) Transcript_33129:624-1490(-)